MTKDDRELLDNILLPFHAIHDLLEGSLKMVSSSNVATLLVLALNRAESLADGLEIE